MKLNMVVGCAVVQVVQSELQLQFGDFDMKLASPDPLYDQCQCNLVAPEFGTALAQCGYREVRCRIPESERMLLLVGNVGCSQACS